MKLPQRADWRIIINKEMFTTDLFSTLHAPDQVFIKEKKSICESILTLDSNIKVRYIVKSQDM